MNSFSYYFITGSSPIYANNRFGPGVIIMSVTVYSTTTCPYCVMAKEYLKKKNVSFNDINVSMDMAKAQEMIRKSGQTGVPVLDINGKIIVGFDREAIDEALSSQ